MFYIIVIVVLLIVVVSLFSGILRFIREHIALSLCVCILVLSGFLGGLKALLVVAIVMAIAYLLYRLYKKAQARIAEENKLKLQIWLETNGKMLGEASNSLALLSRVPDGLRTCIYPTPNTAAEVTETFLHDCDNAFRTDVKETLYGFAHEDGIISVNSAIERTSKALALKTHSIDCGNECRAAIFALVCENKLDYPIADKSQLHCIGVENGRCLETEYIDLE